LLSIISIVIIKKGWRGLNGPISERLLRLCGTFTVWIPSKPSLSRSFKGWTLLSAATAPGNQKSTGANELPVAISTDNRWLVTGSWDKTARLWLLQMSDLVHLARATVGRNFFANEWQLYFPAERYRKMFPDLPGPDERYLAHAEPDGPAIGRRKSSRQDSRHAKYPGRIRLK